MWTNCHYLALTITKEHEMALKKQIQEQIDRGFSKKDLETLIGLPANNLAGFMKGERNFSKKNILRIERFLASANNFDPLELDTIKKSIPHYGGNLINEDKFPKQQVKDLNKPTNQVKEIKAAESNSVIDTRPPMPVRESFEDDWDYRAAKNEWKQKYGQ